MKNHLFVVCLLVASTCYAGPFGRRVYQPSGCANGTCEAPKPVVKVETPQVKVQRIVKVELNDVEKELIVKINAHRVRNGLAELLIDDGLINTARVHCRWMASNRSMTHSRGVAENIAAGQTSSEAAVTAWMNSRGHRANILGRYTSVGVTGHQAANGTWYWCLQLK